MTPILQQPSTKQDILGYLLKRGPSTAQAIADHLGITPQAIRRHLKELETDGLIQHQAVQAGMGRPNHVYQLSPSGQELFPHHYDQFAIALLDTLKDTVGQDQVSSILRRQWERKAEAYRQRIGNGSLQERVAALVELRRAEGFMAEWYIPDADVSAQGTNSLPLANTGQRFIITEYNCAISNIAQSFPTVCGHELEMFAAALQGCTVERTHWLVNGEHRCGYLIQG